MRKYTKYYKWYLDSEELWLAGEVPERVRDYIPHVDEVIEYEDEYSLIPVFSEHWKNSENIRSIVIHFENDPSAAGFICYHFNQLKKLIGDKNVKKLCRILGTSYREIAFMHSPKHPQYLLRMEEQQRNAAAVAAGIEEEEAAE